MDKRKYVSKFMTHFKHDIIQKNKHNTQLHELSSLSKVQVAPNKLKTSLKEYQDIIDLIYSMLKTSGKYPQFTAC